MLDCEPDTLRHLTTAASSATALDESFWTIAGSIDTLTPPEGWPAVRDVVGSDPDNRSTDTFTDPTSLSSSEIAMRLRQLATVYREGLISDGEYAEQRARILSEL